MVLFLPTDSFHMSKNQVIEMGVAPLTTIPGDLTKTLLSVPMVLFYVGVEVLFPKKGILDWETQQGFY